MGEQDSAPDDIKLQAVIDAVMVPDEEIIWLNRKIVEQNARIIEMNFKMLEWLNAPPSWGITNG